MDEVKPPIRSNEQRKKTHRVTFETDENDEIVKHSIESPLYLTGRDISRLWWSDDEFQMIRERTRHFVKLFKRRESYITEFIGVFYQCCKSKEDDGNDLPETSLQFANASARGLEVNVFSLLDKYRMKHVDAILILQGKLLGRVDAQGREKLLADRSAQLSQPGRLLARVFGEADTMASK